METTKTKAAEEVYGTPHPDAPPELQQFAFFIGTWQCSGLDRHEDGTEEPFEAVWTGRWALDGHVIADDYEARDSDGHRVVLGSHYRFFNAKTRRWVMKWHDALDTSWIDLCPPDLGGVTVAANGEISYIFRFNDELLGRVTIGNISDEHFTWRADASRDQGESWTTFRVLEAHRGDPDELPPPPDGYHGRSDTPHPDAPPELGKFAFLIGVWDCRGRLKGEGDEWSEFTADWVGRYILEGRAIADEFRAVWPDGSLFKHGQNVRVYNAEEKSWQMRWIDVGDAEILRLGTPELGGVEQDNGDISFQLRHPDGLIRATFTEISADGFTWRGALSVDEGTTWDEVMVIDAKRAQDQ